MQGHRIALDLDAVHRFQEVIANAKKWGMFGDAAQRALRDYAVASVSIWQDAGELCLRAQFEGATAMSRWLSEYQTDWLSDWSMLTRVDETSVPWREWMGALERGMTEVVRPNGIGAMSARRRAGANATHEVPSMQNRRIAFIADGIGGLGAAIGRHLHAAGLTVTVSHRNIVTTRRHGSWWSATQAGPCTPSKSMSPISNRACYVEQPI